MQFVRAGLPDHDPYRAWTNFTFLGRDGTLNEVDLLVASPTGLFLVEIKSRPGELTGDAGTWIWTSDGRRYTDDNPLLLADKKCKRLKTLLSVQTAAKKIRLPFIAPLVFCSDKDLKNHLSDHARQGVFLRDRDRMPEQGPRRGIIWALTEWPPELDEDTRQRRRLDRPTVKAIARALEEAGVAPSQRSRRVGDYVRGELLFEGPGYQDWSGRHVSLENINRRLRIYTYGGAASPADRDTIRRAAQREFQILEGISHRGILKANEFRDLDQGAAVIFDRDPKAIRLDHYIRQHGHSLSLRDRLTLLRQLAEALQYAHDKKITHRALSPQSILVRNPNAAEPELQIFNWQTAAREIRSSGHTRDRFTATNHLEQLIEDASTVYVAPEALTSEHATGEQLDVFSLGAIAYFLFTGDPPAAGPAELQQKLRDDHGLQLSAALDGAPPALQDLVQTATAPAVIDRLDSVEDFLVYLAEAETQLIAPTPDTVANVIEARTGDSLGNGIVVEKRLGRGSTAVAYLVTYEGNEYVLKLAINPDHNDRLKDEAEVLAKLRDRHIVEVVRIEKIGNHLGILMKRAGEKTLARRLREEGRLELELLERFGEQLLRAVDFLEQQGIPHRDIKPENIGVRQSGKGSRLELVLFDFSLSRTPVEQIEAGTRPYLDPFLGERKPRRWDTYAERYAAAVTLYEMATGTFPVWGDGESHPGVLDCEVTLDPELFDASVREAMTTFFETTFRRNHAQRFDNAEEMLKAWRQVFELTERRDRPLERDTDTDTDAATHLQLDGVTGTTPLGDLGLSTRALNALERRGAQHAGDLLPLTMAQITRTPGIGTKTRREIAALLRELRKRIPTETQPTDGSGKPARSAEQPKDDVTVYGVERLAALLIPTRTSGRADPSRRQLEVFLGLASDSQQGWPSQTDVAEALGLTRARIGQVLAKARERWAKHTALNALRDDIATLLSEHGGVMPAAELCAAVLALRGSTEEEPRRSVLAAAVTRAAIEAERTRQTQRWINRRKGTRVLVAADDPATGLDGQALADYAEALGRTADLLAATNPLPAPNRALEALRAVRTPANAPTLSDDRLLRLATAASDTAALSSRQEIYPRDMPADRAVKLAQGALLGARELTVEQIRQRVRGRYPEAASLPDRPALDSVIGLVCDLEWNDKAGDGRGAYRFKASDIGTITTGPTSLGRYSTSHTVIDGNDPEGERAQAFEDRLARAASAGGFLALTTAPRHAERVAGEIARRFPVVRCDLDEMLIRHMKTTVELMKARWDVVLKADLDGPTGPDWGKLLSVVGRALPAVEQEVKATNRPVLLCHPGLLARYAKLDLLERLREAANRGEELRGLWVLIPSDEQHQMPMLDGVAVPVITPAQWARIPEPWIENRHRGQPT